MKRGAQRLDRLSPSRRALALVCAGLMAAVLLAGAKGLATADSVPYGLDLQGKQVTRLGSPHDRLIVLLFTASDCPIASRYVPEIARLQKEFESQGVAFWWVYPNPSDTASVVRAHTRDFGPQSQVILDRSQRLVRMAHAIVTPQSAVFLITPGGLKEVYSGRIDDKYLAIGQERPHAFRHDLESVIAASLAGRPVPVASGPPVGCSIVPLP